MRSWKRLWSWIACSMMALWVVGVAHAGEVGYYRDPGLHGNRVFFTAEGDLWSAPVSGGAARRLTRHPEAESQVAVSPDGRMLAFAASYDGPREAYVMPVTGGMPRRVSFDGGRIDVLGWTPDGRVLYASRSRSGPSQRRVVRMVDAESLETGTLPVLDANQAAIDADSGAVAFVRFGLRITGDNVRRYRGGAMAQLWKMGGIDAERADRLVPDLGANASDPMWWDGRLYFVSDRSGTANLWSIDPNGGGLEQHTHHEEWAVREPALEGGRVVYQYGADLRAIDLASGSDSPIAIELVGDFDSRRERWLAEPLEYLEAAQPSWKGDRVALTARGRAVLAGLGRLRRVELASSGTNRVRGAVPGAEGNWIYALSDASGRNEIWRFPVRAGGEAEQLTTDGGAHRWRIHPSPDGRYLAHDDINGDLWLLDLESGENRKIHSTQDGVDDAFGTPAWSADGTAIAFARPGGPRQVNQVVVHSISDGTTHVLTSDRYESYSPTFSPDGKWLYFLSERHFQAYPSGPWGDRNTGPGFDRRGRMYALALQSDSRFPFLAPDELHSEPPEDENAETTEQASVPSIDYDGLSDRLYEVPVEPGNYLALRAGSDRLYVLDRAVGSDENADLETLEMTWKKPELETFMKGVASYSLLAGAKKLFVMKAGEGREMFLLDAGAKAPDELDEVRVRIADWQLAIDPDDEWRQMFVDAWRMHRDFSFDPKMRGLDWDAVRQRYEPLVARVTDRWELSDLLGQMVGELGILHSQVRSGDVPSDPESAEPAFLGAELRAADGGLEIIRIYRSDPELPGERAPLLRPGVDAAVGDVLVGVNGKPVTSTRELAEALDYQAGQQVLLELRRGSESHQTVVTPVAASSESRLRYRDWTYGSGEAVKAASDGRIGYLHLRAMGGRDIAHFVREFYANYDREGLIIDVRNNWGGNIDSWVIEKLLRRVWAFWQPRDHGRPFSNMPATFRGHLAVLINEGTYSDGETFAAGVRALGLAPLIGTTTAGAGIWLSDRNSLSDRGRARIAEFPQFGLDGRWLIEGRGVSPDLEVDNDPVAAFQGEDRQLDEAIAYLQSKLEEEPIPPLEGEQSFPLSEPGRDVDVP